MRFLFRWAFRLFLVIVVLVVALLLLKDTLLKSYAEARIRRQTGMEARLGKLEVGVFSPTLTVEDFRLYNRAEFGGSPLLDVPELHLECDASALASRKLRFKLVRLHIRELNIVEDQAGRTNVSDWLGELEKVMTTPGRGGSAEFGGIETLNVTLGKIRYGSLKQPAQVSEVELGLKNQIFTNVQSMEELYGLLVKVLFQKGVTISLSGSRGGSPRPGLGRPQGRTELRPSSSQKPALAR